MLQRNLRDLFAQTMLFGRGQNQTPTAEGQLKLISHEVAIFDKSQVPVVYVMDESGDSITAISIPRNVVVPLVRYDFEADVQDRIAALIAALAGPPQVMPLREVFAMARVALGERLAAFITNESVAGRLDVLLAEITTPEDVPPPVYVTQRKLAEGTIYAVPFPEYLGHVIIRAPENATGLICHGRVAHFKVTESS